MDVVENGMYHPPTGLVLFIILGRWWWWTLEQYPIFRQTHIILRYSRFISKGHRCWLQNVWLWWFQMRDFGGYSLRIHRGPSQESSKLWLEMMVSPSISSFSAILPRYCLDMLNKLKLRSSKLGLAQLVARNGTSFQTETWTLYCTLFSGKLTSSNDVLVTQFFCSL